jgi:heat shock protein HtpX
MAAPVGPQGVRKRPDIAFASICAILNQKLGKNITRSLGRREPNGMGNQIRTTSLLAALTALIALIETGSRATGMFVAPLVAAGMNFFSYWFRTRSFSGCTMPRRWSQKPLTWERYRHLPTTKPPPEGLRDPSGGAKCLATGNPEHAAVAVTEAAQAHGRKADGVAGAGCSVRNRDILIGSIAATMAGAIMMLANMARWSAIFGGGSRDREEGSAGGLGLILMSIIAPLAAMLIQMAISRSREYMADATGASLAGTPEGLARALEKLGAYSKRLPMDASPSTAHMFIVNPLSGRSLMSLFSTHPPLEERIARLRGGRIPEAQAPPDAGPADRKEHARAMWDRLSGKK